MPTPVAMPSCEPKRVTTCPSTGQLHCGGGRFGKAGSGAGFVGLGFEAPGPPVAPVAGALPRVAGALDGFEALACFFAPVSGGDSRRRWPTWIKSGFLMPFQRARSRWSTPCCHAIENNVSPARTTYMRCSYGGELVQALKPSTSAASRTQRRRAASRAQTRGAANGARRPAPRARRTSELRPRDHRHEVYRQQLLSLDLGPAPRHAQELLHRTARAELRADRDDHSAAVVELLDELGRNP